MSVEERVNGAVVTMEETETEDMAVVPPGEIVSGVSVELISKRSWQMYLSGIRSEMSMYLNFTVVPVSQP